MPHKRSENCPHILTWEAGWHVPPLARRACGIKGDYLQSILPHTCIILSPLRRLVQLMSCLQRALVVMVALVALSATAVRCATAAAAAAAAAAAVARPLLGSRPRDDPPPLPSPCCCLPTSAAPIVGRLRRTARHWPTSTAFVPGMGESGRRASLPAVACGWPVRCLSAGRQLRCTVLLLQPTHIHMHTPPLPPPSHHHHQTTLLTHPHPLTPAMQLATCHLE